MGGQANGAAAGNQVRQWPVESWSCIRVRVWLKWEFASVSFSSRAQQSVPRTKRRDEPLSPRSDSRAGLFAAPQLPRPNVPTGTRVDDHAPAII